MGAGGAAQLADRRRRLDRGLGGSTGHSGRNFDDLAREAEVAIKAFMRVNDDGRTVAAMDVLAMGIGKINFTREPPPCTSRARPDCRGGAVSAYRGPRPS
jgi:hypothetical protein